MTTEARHPDLPSPPKTSYVYFTRATRPQIQQLNPTMSGREIMTTIANLWRNMNRDERREYEDLARADRLRYEQEMDIFIANHPDIPPPPDPLTLLEQTRANNPDVFVLDTQTGHYRRRRSPPNFLDQQNLPLYEDKIVDIEPEQCSICMTELKEDVVKLINCTHKFHRQCILNWGRTKSIKDSANKPAIKCPLCRTVSFGIKKIKKRRSKRKSKKRRSKSRSKRRSKSRSKRRSKKVN